MSLEKAIKIWIDEKKYLPCDISEAYSMFIKDTNEKCSRSYFYQIFNNFTKTQVIKTGGVYTNSNDIIDTIIQRNKYGVYMKNTFSIDEKPIIIKNYRQKKVRVALTNKGKVPSNKIEEYKKFDKLTNIYLLCCIFHFFFFF